jgi:hypothetical protein
LGEAVCYSSENLVAGHRLDAPGTKLGEPGFSNFCPRLVDFRIRDVQGLKKGIDNGHAVVHRKLLSFLDDVFHSVHFNPPAKLNAPGTTVKTAPSPGTQWSETSQRDDNGSAIVCFSIMLKSSFDLSTSQSHKLRGAVSRWLFELWAVSGG